MWKLSQAYFGGELLPAGSPVDREKDDECRAMILQLLQVGWVGSKDRSKLKLKFKLSAVLPFPR